MGKSETLTHLTDITVDMEAAVQSYDPHGLLLARFRHDGLAAHRAAGRILPVRENVTLHSKLKSVARRFCFN